MRTADRELTLVGSYDYVVINDDVPRAADELISLVERLAEEKD
jgi:guanylate kinase